eukprot:COSAG02_NODE_354_length_24016_cov_208.299231_18_plen_86_part_00
MRARARAALAPARGPIAVRSKRNERIIPVEMAALLLPAAALASMVAAEGPCDILAAAGNPCVAAHSTVRVSTRSCRAIRVQPRAA